MNKELLKKCLPSIIALILGVIVTVLLLISVVLVIISYTQFYESYNFSDEIRFFALTFYCSFMVLWALFALKVIDMFRTLMKSYSDNLIKILERNKK